MTVHAIPNVRGTSLSAQLAGLGLIRLLGEQADPALRCRFDGPSLLIDTTVPDLADWLVDEYAPTPVLSPWNEGSGFGEKDKAPKAALRALLSLGSPRLDDFRQAHDVSAPLAALARAEKWPKERMIAALRARCPDSMLVWLDAAVVLLSRNDRNELAFPPLLGSGGNDGRLDFSTNFHQRLLDVLPVDEASRLRSLRSASDWLTGTVDQPLAKAAIGQFDPGSAGTPNSSPYGTADPLVNPWLFVLMLEGATLFASTPARRLTGEASQQSRAAMPFMTSGSPFGTGTGSTAEDSRGEIWFPWWSGWLSLNAVRQLFAEGRAVWRRRIASQPAQMYLAAASQGLSPAITGFDRYTILKRNGLAFSAVLADSVRVRSNQSVRVVEAVEDWPDWIRGRELPNTIRAPQNMFQRAKIDLARAPSTAGQIRGVRDLLSSVTALELAVGRSGRSRDDNPPWGVARSPRALVEMFLQPEWSSEANTSEFRIALSLASMVSAPTPDAPVGRTLREILVPINPAKRPGERPQWRQTSIVTGFRQRPLTNVLSDVLVWLTVTAPGQAAKDTPFGPRAQDVDVILSHSVATPWADTHAWLAGALDDQRIEDWLAAFLPFDWRDHKALLSERQARSVEAPSEPQVALDPTLALLTRFRNGMRRRSPEDRHDARAAIDRRGERWVSPTTRRDQADDTKYGLRSEWVTLLTSGHPDRAHLAAASRLRMLGYKTVGIPAVRPAHDRGTRLAAALVPDAANPPLHVIARPVRDDRQDLDQPNSETATEQKEDIA